MIELISGYGRFFMKKKKALLRLARGVFDRAVLGRPHLRVCEIATTFQCNSACVMCSCSKLLDAAKEKQRMSPQEYADLGRQLDKLGCISVNVTGGEPLMRDDIEAVIRALNPSRKITNLITNGINLSGEDLKKYASLGVDSVVVSLESTDASENDRIRGRRGHFEAVMNAMRWAKEVKIDFGVSLTLGDFNFEKIRQLLGFAEANKIFLCIAHGGSIGNWADDNTVRLSEKNAREVLGLVKRQKRMKIDFSANLDLRPGCPAMVEKMYVTPYAEVFPCAFNPISFGNLREEPLAAIWRRMTQFRRKNVRSRPLCLRTYDEDYIKRFLDPIKDARHPVRIQDHPAFQEERAAR